MDLLMAMNERHAVRDYTNRQRAKNTCWAAMTYNKGKENLVITMGIWIEGDSVY